MSVITILWIEFPAPSPLQEWMYGLLIAHTMITIYAKYRNRECRRCLIDSGEIRSGERTVPIATYVEELAREHFSVWAKAIAGEMKDDSLFTICIQLCIQYYYYFIKFTKIFSLLQFSVVKLKI